MGKDHEDGMDYAKPSESNLIKTLEVSIRFGRWVLLENIGL